MKKSYLLSLVFLVAILSGVRNSAWGQYTGAAHVTVPGTYTYTVGAGITSLLMDVQGAQGGTYSASYGSGGGGGRVQCKLAVSGGQVLTFIVAGQGGVGPGGCCSGPAAAGGYPNGGVGGTYYYSDGGGGSSEIKNGAVRLIVAGGGGGAGYGACSNGCQGGGGGGLTGEGGYACGSTSYSTCYNSGPGGSQTGPGGTSSCTNGNTGGSGGTGGTGSIYYGGGGGGGYYGGGGGYYSGGAGGSSFPAAASGAVSSLTHTQGFNTAGNGIVDICPAPIIGTIAGSSTVCPGGGTTQLSNSVSGGVWSSSNVAVASVNASSGVVTGIIQGAVTISYTVSNNCTSSTVTRSMTVLTPSAVYNVTGGGGYCVGATGSPVGLDNSELNTTYYLVNGSTVVKSITPTVVGPIDFTPVTSVGSLNVVAVSASTTCSLTMAGNATVFNNPLPVTAGHTVTGSGSYCAGQNGLHVVLTPTDLGITYVPVHAPTDTVWSQQRNGTGSAIDFGADTAGTYTVIGITSFGCQVAMPGSAVIVKNPLPILHNVTGGATQYYCTGGAGDSVGLDASESGIQYDLYNGPKFMNTITSTGGKLFFGLQSQAGTYTVMATDPSKPTMCSQQMTGSSTIVAANNPNLYSVTGTAPGYCTNLASTVSIQMSGFDPTVIYYLYTAPGVLSTKTPSISGGTNFGTQNYGTYTVIGKDRISGCQAQMLNTPSIVPYPIPTIDTLISEGKASYCAGLNGVQLDMKYADMGINYQLTLNGNPYETIEGQNGTLKFTKDTIAGTYTVTATNKNTGCKVGMAGSIKVSIDPLPLNHQMTGGGAYCENGPGLPITVNGSETGIKYQLYTVNGAIFTPVGTSIPGTGGTITFGSKTDSGAYTAIATNTTTSCVDTMAGTSKIKINAAPEGFLIHGGGVFCSGTSGVLIGLDNSAKDTVNYQLYMGSTPIGAGLSTSGGYFDFAPQTTIGTYTVKATNLKTTCTAFMLGSTTVNVNPAPTIYAVMGGGTYCFGTAGADVTLSNSDVGISYQLIKDGTTSIGLPVPGSGKTLDFGAQPLAGTYTALATNVLSGCYATMSGNAKVTVSPLPVAQTVTTSLPGGFYCLGDTGVHIFTGNSELGVSYQLYQGTTLIGTAKVGNKKALDFGLKTAPGVYTIRGTNATTGCLSNMANTVTISINPAPNAYAVGGGGAYCANGTGVAVTMTPTSDIGVTYTLYLNGVATTTTRNGGGTALDFGAQMAAGTYTIKAMDNTSGCPGPMSGSTTITILPTPKVYNVTGGGAYCAGGTGKNVYLSNSDAGIQYQLQNGSTADGLAKSGSGASLDFGVKSTAGVYSVIAKNPTTTCSDTTTVNATVTVNALPQVDTVTGGGHFCIGTSGVSVDLKNSLTTVQYQLYNGVTSIGAPMTGTGSVLHFGSKTMAGTYTVVASDNTLPTHCAANMYASAVVTPDSVVTPNIVIGTGPLSVCEGDTISFTAGQTNGGTAPQYQWNINGTPVAGATTTAYTYVPTDKDIVSATLVSNANCVSTSTVTAALTMTVNKKVDGMAMIEITDPMSGAICPGTAVTYHAITRNVGVTPAPTYAWFKNGAPTSGTVYNVVTPANGDDISVTVTSSEKCTNTPTITSHFTATVTPVATPAAVKLVSSAGTSLIAGKLDTMTVTYTTGSAGATPTFVWLINGNIVDGENTNMLISDNFSSHDSITCIVTGSGSCGGTSVSASKTVTVRDATAVNQVTGVASEIRVVPNPNKGTFSVKGVLSNTDQHATIEITNMIGQVVYKSNATVNNGLINEQVQLNNTLANGMYILNVRSGSENTAFHFVLEQ